LASFNRELFRTRTPYHSS